MVYMYRSLLESDSRINMNSGSKLSSINHSLTPKRLSYGEISIDTDSCTVTYDGTTIPLYPKEYNLLVLFLKYPNHILSHDLIIDRLWEIDKIPTYGSIRAHIKGLRKAFKKANVKEEIIETVHGMGYRLKPLKKDASTNPIIAPPLSIMKVFFQAKAIEYLVIDSQFIIQYISPGLLNYCDYPAVLEVGIKGEEAFPEFIGLEETFEKIINQELSYFEIKGIARSANPARPEYINFYVMSDDSQKLEQSENKLLFILFEDASEHMTYKQRLVQIENSLYLKLEVNPHNHN
jgi:DNA-binding winged helix-turn-helix (wHTH) protein